MKLQDILINIRLENLKYFRKYIEKKDILCIHCNKYAGKHYLTNCYRGDTDPAVIIYDNPYCNINDLLLPTCFKPSDKDRLK